MALADHTIGYAATDPALAQPGTSETIVTPGDDTLLMVVIGSTATVVTIVRPGNDAVGVAVPDQVSGSLTSVTRFFKVDRNYRDPTTGNATVTFSQVTGVTAAVVRAS